MEEKIKLKEFMQKDLFSKLTAYTEKKNKLKPYFQNIIDDIQSRDQFFIDLQFLDAERKIEAKEVESIILKRNYEYTFGTALNIANYIENHNELRQYFKELLSYRINFENNYKFWLEAEKLGVQDFQRNSYRMLLEFQSFVNNLKETGKEYPSSIVFKNNTGKTYKEIEINKSLILYEISRAVFNNPDIIEELKKQIPEEIKLSKRTGTDSKEILEHYIMRLYNLLKDIDAYKGKGILSTKLCVVIAELLHNTDYNSNDVDTIIRAHLKANT